MKAIGFIAGSKNGFHSGRNLAFGFDPPALIDSSTGQRSPG
jgi:hypothetical protein